MTQSFCRKRKASPFLKTVLYQLLGYSVHNKDKVIFTPGLGGTPFKRDRGACCALKGVKSRLKCLT